MKMLMGGSCARVLGFEARVDVAPDEIQTSMGSGQEQTARL